MTRPRAIMREEQRVRSFNAKNKSNINNIEGTKKSAPTKDLASEHESDNDNISDISNIAENADPSSINECVDLSPSECYEKKFSQALENVTQKSSKTRALALQSLCEILMYRYMPDYVDERKVILRDCIEKSIHRDKCTTEQLWALRLAPLLLLQLGRDEDIFISLNQILLTTMQDKSISFDVRAKFCTALGLLNFLADADIDDILIMMKGFEGIFSASYLKNDDTTPLSVSAEAGTLHAKALSAWGLLLTRIPPAHLVSWMNDKSILPTFKKLMGLLQSPHLALRMVAGETLALILDCGRAHDAEFLNEHLNDLTESVKQLATDSDKHRAKRNRKAQRPLFRDVLRYLEENICPKTTIRFGTRIEFLDYSLVLNSWAMHCQYSALCVVTGPGMTTQLKENQFVRDLFNLGPKLVPTTSKPRIIYSKYFKHSKHNAAFKARTISRAENRLIKFN